MQERYGVITFKGQPLTLLGPELKVGDPAPDFQVVTTDLRTLTLHDLPGTVKVLASVPSLDTSVCDQETRRFNELAPQMGDDVQVVTISMDLPFAQARWCGATGVDRVMTVSDYRERSFGLNYGVLIKELMLLARAVFIVDGNARIRYIQMVPEVSQLPDFDEVLEAIRNL